MNKEFVVLLDSKKERQANFLGDAFPKLKNYNFLKLFDNVEDVLDFIGKEENNIKILLIHKSDVELKTAKEQIESQNVDLVYFTGSNLGKRLRQLKNPKAELSASDFYKHLLFFLKKFNEDDYQLGYLVFGENFLLNQFLNFRMYLFIYAMKDLEIDIRSSNENSKKVGLDKIYDKLNRKVDIDYLLKLLSPNNTEDELKKDISKLFEKISKKINYYVMYGEQLLP